MHFEILVEGQVELTTLSILMEQILGEYNNPHTWKIHKHRGIGKLPDNPTMPPNKKDNSLLHNLPSKLRAYGKEGRDNLVVVTLVDLDNRNCIHFKQELIRLLQYCSPKPNALFRIAIEEIEAWFLGDLPALKSAYPNAKQAILDKYTQDAQCCTWEALAEAIYPGGLKALEQYGKRSIKILSQKVEWAKKIAPKMNVENNLSPSFCCFRDGLRNKF